MRTADDSRTAWIAGGVLLVLLVAGITRLFHLRFQAGDIYPAYSSLRADPLGTKALYESLAACEGINTRRNHEPLSKLDLGPEATLLFLGDTVPHPEEDLGEVAGFMNSFVRRGGRLVVTFSPRDRKSDEDAEKEEENGKKAEDTAPEAHGEGPEAGGREPDQESAGDEGEDEHPEHRSVTARQWLAVDFHDEPISPGSSAVLSTNLLTRGFPAVISCHTSLFFTEPEHGRNEDSAPEKWPWLVVYERDGRPVVIERRIGKGSIVLSAPSYYVSNEAMKDERHTALLAWLISPGREVVFDETHHGIHEKSSVAALAVKYRLQWLGVGLLALACLFIWQNSVSLVPAHAAAGAAPAPGVSEGKDSTAGLVNLLRRNIQRRRILDVCFAEWKKTARTTDPRIADKAVRMEGILEGEAGLPAGERNPARAYDEMSRILKE